MKKSKYINSLLIILLSCLGITFILLIPKVSNLVFDMSKVEYVVENEVEEMVFTDSSNNDNDIQCSYFSDFIKWKSLDGKYYSLPVKICKNDIENSKSDRESSLAIGIEVWAEMFQNDKIRLKKLIEEYKRVIKLKKLNYLEAMNLIASSAQYDDYTFIEIGKCGMLMGSCKPNGCCSFVKPFAVYSPVEYIVQRTGDCDTKSLYAYTILDELGFDVALAYGVALMPDGSGGPHCVLAAHLPNTPPRGNDYIMDRAGKKYYLWEMTAKNMNLGEWNWTASNLSSWNLVKL